MSKHIECTALQLTNNDIQNLPPGISFNDCGFMYPGCYEKISGRKQKDNPDNDVDLYLAITHQKRTIYLKYRSKNIIQNTLQLSYTNMCRLGIVGLQAPKVKVKKSCGFMFLLRNWNAAVRIPLYLGLLSLFLGFISLIPTIHKLICK